MFSNSIVKDVIEWTKEGKDIEVKKPLSTPGRKFAMMHIVLNGDARVTFETVAEMKTKSTGVNLAGKELPVTGETDTTFKTSYNVFVNRSSNRHDLTKQLNYLRGCLKYPGHRNPHIKLKEFVWRLKSINSKLHNIPSPSKYSGPKFLSTVELLHIFSRSVPYRWYVDLYQGRKSLDDHIFDTLTEYFKVVQIKYKINKGNKNKANNQQKDSNGKRKNVFFLIPVIKVQTAVGINFVICGFYRACYLLTRVFLYQNTQGRQQSTSHIFGDMTTFLINGS